MAVCGALAASGPRWNPAASNSPMGIDQGCGLGENCCVNPRQSNTVYWTKVGQASPAIL